MKLDPAVLERFMATEYNRESEFRRDVIRVARTFGWAIHADPDLRERLPGTPGFPDLILARRVEHSIMSKQFVDAVDAVVLVRELKRNGQYLKAEQDDWRLLIEAAGLDYSVWRPADWPRIVEELE